MKKAAQRKTYWEGFGQLLASLRAKTYPEGTPLRGRQHVVNELRKRGLRMHQSTLALWEEGRSEKIDASRLEALAHLYNAPMPGLLAVLAANRRDRALTVEAALLLLEAHDGHTSAATGLQVQDPLLAKIQTLVDDGLFKMHAGTIVDLGAKLQKIGREILRRQIAIAGALASGSDAGHRKRRG